MPSQNDASCSPQGPLQFCELVLHQIQEGDEGATAALYNRIAGGLRLFLRSRIPADLVEGCLHNVYAIALKALQEGQLRDPQALPGFILTVARSQAAQTMMKIQREQGCTMPMEADTIRDDPEDPGWDRAATRRIGRLREALRDLDPQHRELLARYFLYEQPAEQICKEMQLTETQFRLAKSFAKGTLQAAVRNAEGPRKPRARRMGAGC
jgi:RNA polymerase sigma-70 factor, ECF subfamily